MKAGKPASGLVQETDEGLQAAMGFKADGEAIIADGEHLREQDRIWADAVLAARSVASRFAAAGNRGSAAYYRALANQIEHGRPE